MCLVRLLSFPLCFLLGSSQFVGSFKPGFHYDKHRYSHKQDAHSTSISTYGHAQNCHLSGSIPTQYCYKGCRMMFMLMVGRSHLAQTRSFVLLFACAWAYASVVRPQYCVLVLVLIWKPGLRLVSTSALYILAWTTYADALGDCWLAPFVGTISKQNALIFLSCRPISSLKGFLAGFRREFPNALTCLLHFALHLRSLAH